LLLFAGIGFSAPAAHTQARLVISFESARPGETVVAGVLLHMDKGWHTYWRNSGQSGLPTTIDWQLPAGVTVGTIQWPTPKKVPEKELTTYVYEDEAVLLVPLKLASDLAPGDLDLKAKVSWLECEEKCLPADAQVNVRLVVGTETKSSQDLAFLESWQKKMPKHGEDISAQAHWELSPKGDLRPLIIEWTSAGTITDADFYPDSSEKFEVEPMTEKLTASAGKIRLRAQVQRLAGDWPKNVSGLLIEGSGPRQLAYDVKLSIGGVGSVAVPGTTSATGSIRQPLWVIFLYAFLGGLLMNIMPCVLPVIALKILGFVSEARNEPGHLRKLGLIYTAGVLSSFLILALIDLGLQAAGKAAGWGVQFGNPYFLIAMTILVTLIALNLFGLFEVTLSSGALTAATTLASRQGSGGAFFNGLFTTILATSCTAPFLAPAVGFASVITNPVLTIVILLTVGAGLAAPYLILSFQPAWLKLLPKPGAWMEKFRVAMGFPMIAAAAWLCSILAVHYGDRTWWMVMFLVLISLAVWVYGEFVQRGRSHRGFAALVCVGLLALGYIFALESKLEWRQPIKETTTGSQPSKVAPKGLAWQLWSPEAVAEARAAGRPVVVDFTAKWCPNCNAIIKPSFENVAVQKRLKDVNAVALIADYTLHPDNITAELKRFQRAGVPLVVIYSSNPDEAPLVFDLVWPGTILDALSRVTLQSKAEAMADGAGRPTTDTRK